MTIDPTLLAAYADGELGPEDAARVEAAMAADPSLAQEVEAHRALRATLSAHFAPILDRPVPVRLVEMLEPRDNVIDFAQARREKTQVATEPPSRTRWILGGAIAASLALGLVIGGKTDPGSSVISRDGQLVASATLDKALTRQLASAQDDTDVRILLSFKDGDGRYCRGFQQGATAGIACRSGDLWSIERTQASGGKVGQGGYRQAGSAAREIMAAAQDMAVGDALDAAAEKTARDADWHP